MLEFDLGSLSLDLDNGPATESPIHAMTATSDDPLETKFQLAEEFRALGDWMVPGHWQKKCLRKPRVR